MSDPNGTKAKRRKKTKGYIYARDDRTRTRREQRKYECGRKEKYMKRCDAERVAQEAANRTNQWFNAYFCKHCGAYHIGHAQLRKVMNMPNYESRVIRPQAAAGQEMEECDAASR